MEAPVPTHLYSENTFELPWASGWEGVDPLRSPATIPGGDGKSSMAINSW
jgi:hypothetical protein